MNKIEMLQYIIDHDGECFKLKCLTCPLAMAPKSGNCIDRALQNKFNIHNMDKVCVHMAQQMLNKIIEGTLLGTSNDKD